MSNKQLSAVTRTAVAGVVIALIAVAVSPADARRPRPGHYSGAVTPTAIDTNGDGFVATVSHFRIRSSRGRAVAVTLAEFTAPVLAAPGECEGLGLGDGPFTRNSLLWMHGVVTYSRDRSQWFKRAESARVCVNVITGAAYIEEEGVYFAGTGRFAGKTATYTAEARGQFFVPGLSFGAWTGESLIVPDE